MRIKNEARWIAKVIESQLPVVQQLLILDDHSTDGTQDICRSYPKVTLFDSPFEGVQETRDKRWLMEQLGKVAQPGDWCLSIDGDEEIAKPGQQVIAQLGSQPFGPDAYRFHVLYLWDGPDKIRTDGIYENFWRGSMFRYRLGTTFHSSNGGGFHCGNVPEPRVIERAPVKILHYGYMHKEDRLRKMEWYNRIDPNNVNEDCYRHMVIGDMFPADSKFLHAGPLKLEPITVMA
jgi:glycosyltransferase involved in cell wall biosynthesis